jgi:hypothetical protein
MAAEHPERRGFSRCPNCGTDLDPAWAFCPGCGQENEEQVLPFRVLVRDFFSDFLTFDSRFFRTLVPFFARPGDITADYLSGRRVRYVAPMRILLFGCLILFALAGRKVSQRDWKDAIQVGTGSGFNIEVTRDDTLELETDTGTAVMTLGEAAAMAGTPLPDSLPVVGNPVRDFAAGFREGVTGADTMPRDTVAERPDNWLDMVGERIPALSEDLSPEQIADSLAPADSYWRHRMVLQMAKVYQSGGEGLMSFMVSNGTLSVFLAVLVLAAFLKLLYWRRKRRYVEHVVFSLHAHAALVYLVALLLLIDWIFGRTWPLAALILLPYYLVSLKRVYGQSWGKTVLKFLVAGSFYLYLLLPVLLVLALGVSFLFF